MASFLLRRLGAVALTMLALTLIVFALVNLEPNLVKLALEQTSARATPAQVEAWLTEHGYREPFFARYGDWLWGVVQGDFGWSTRFREPVNAVIWTRLGYTATLAFWVLAVMIPGALLVGVLAGMREGSRLDRGLSTFSILTSATPEYVSGIVFTVIFATQLGWLRGVARAGEPSFDTLALPVMTMAIYGMGYISRMTRASMAEVMTSQYIRTARLKGLPFRDVVLRHALRNALIAPFTVIMLQFPWLLTGVVIVESLFNYRGFGWTLVEAADNNDIDLVLACSVVSVGVVLVTQLISDIGYAALNPRIRLA